MTSGLRFVLLAALLALLAGCAGRDFVRPSSGTLQLGKSTYSQVVEQMGRRGKFGDVLKNGKNIRSVTYVFATTGGDPLEPGVIPARALLYYFHDDVLVGQQFISSFKSDHSYFDDRKIPQISKGKSTRSEVIQLMGRPSASFIFPMVKQTSGEAIGYDYRPARGGVFRRVRFYVKSLRVTFDDKDRVLDVEYETSGKKPKKRPNLEGS